MNANIDHRLAGVETLYQLAENIRRERSLWADERARRALLHAAQQIEAAARQALGESEVWADSWAEAGTLVLRAWIAERRFVQAIVNVPSRKRRRHITLDCRDGQHTACVTCHCHCHH